jgi:hypothetical protein
MFISIVKVHHTDITRTESGHTPDELSHKTVDQFVEDVLALELERWDVAFPLPVPPEDLQRALDANPAAAAFFATVVLT